MTTAPDISAIPSIFGLSLLSDWVGLLGLLLTLIGFAFTIISVRKSKVAADQAKKAADLATEAIRKYNTVADLSSVIAKLDEAKRLNRIYGWEILAERYSETKKLLSSINQPVYCFSQDQKVKLQNATTQLSKMESAVDKAVFEETRDKSMLLKHSKILSSIIDDVISVVSSVKCA